MQLSVVVKALAFVALSVPVTVAVPIGPSAGANGAVNTVDYTTANGALLTTRETEAVEAPSKIQARSSRGKRKREGKSGKRKRQRKKPEETKDKRALAELEA
ncbi:hypothetical protein PspLS_09365 [Pyricularia sp. CBS 133598]|nr:hypothetical protein PspLS_09365 [Pyricularia sp. CBS 133598]